MISIFIQIQCEIVNFLKIVMYSNIHSREAKCVATDMSACNALKYQQRFRSDYSNLFRVE